MRNMWVLVIFISSLFATSGEGVKREMVGKKEPHRKIQPMAHHVVNPEGGIRTTVPSMINYQGFLASSSDSTPLDTTVDITFRIYDSDAGGTELWAEIHSNVQVVKGIFNALLGSTTPIPGDVFDGNPRWLQVEVGGEVLSPRKEMVSVPYSFRSGYADSAGYATGGSVSYADSAGHLVGPDSIYANASNNGVLYLMNSASNGYGIRLRSGDDGIRIDSTGGDGLYIQKAGNGVNVHTVSGDGCYIYSASRGIYVHSAGHDGVYVNDAGDNGIQIWNADTNGIYVHNAMHDGVLVHNSSDDGVQIDSVGDDGVYIQKASGDGMLVQNAGANGIQIWNADTNGIYVNSVGKYGLSIGNAGWDGIHVNSAGDDAVSVYDAGGDGLFVNNAGYVGVEATGRMSGGVFKNDTTGASWPALHVDNLYGNTSYERIANFWAGVSYLRFYFQGDGNAYADQGWNTFRKNSKGEYEAFSGVQAERQEIVAHGTGRLQNGVAHISFSSSFSEFITRVEDIEITVTPVGSYSGLYIAERSPEGFTVKSGAGDPNCEFTWIAIGVEKGKEVRAKVGNIDEEERMAMQMERERRERERAKRESYLKRHPKKQAELLKENPRFEEVKMRETGRKER